MTKRVLYLFPLATKLKLSLLPHLGNYLISSGTTTVLWLMLKKKNESII